MAPGSPTAGGTTLVVVPYPAEGPGVEPEAGPGVASRG